MSELNSELNSDLKKHFQKLADKWPSGIIAREKVGDFTGGVISPGRMANLDCLGEGPERLKISRKVAYPVQPFIDWLVKRSVALG